MGPLHCILISAVQLIVKIIVVIFVTHHILLQYQRQVPQIAQIFEMLILYSRY